MGKLLAKANGKSLSNPNILKKGKKRKITTWRMILWGLNLIVGYSFLIAVAPSYNSLGALCLILLFISGFLAACSGYAFGKLSNKFFRENGGVMHYANRVLGKRAAGFFGFFQLIQLIIISSTVAIGFIWAFGSTKLPGHHGSVKLLANQWYVIVICIVFFFIVSAIPRLGFSTNKTSLIFVWIAKWFIIVGSILVAIILFKGSHFTDFVGHHLKIPNNSIHSSSTITRFFQLFSGLFFFYFAFSGIEIIPTMLRDIKDSKKNIMRIILTIVAGTLIFYLAYYVLIGSALGVSSSGNISAFGVPFGDPTGVNVNQYNPVLSVFSKFFQHYHLNGKGNSSNELSGSIVGTIVLVLIVIAMFANKSAGRMQQGWANTRVVSSYSRLGFLPKMFHIHKNKYGQFTYAFWFDFIVAGVFSVIFLFLNIIASATHNPLLNVGFQAPLELTTFCGFLQYICAFLILFILGLRYFVLKKKAPHLLNKNIEDFIMKMTRKMLFFYGVLLFIIIALVDLWIGNLVFDLSQQIHNGKIQTNGYSDIVEIVLVIVSIIGAISISELGVRVHHKNEAQKTKLEANLQLMKQKAITT